MTTLPKFPYHRDPMSSGSLQESDDACACCGMSRGILYAGNVYSRERPENLCPWCIADGSAAAKYDAEFFDAYFCDDDLNEVDLPVSTRLEVFGRTVGFATFNPIAWWVHCNQPAEYVTRNEPYEMIFECRICHKRHSIDDLD